LKRQEIKGDLELNKDNEKPIFESWEQVKSRETDE
jgi:hypothetical protein